MAISKEEIERNFALIEAAAINGDRCPMNHPYGPLSNGAMTALYESGRIFGEIIGRNYRVITILTGPNAGKTTAQPPVPAPPWKIIGRASRIGGEVVGNSRALSCARHIRPFAARGKIAP